MNEIHISVLNVFTIQMLNFIMVYSFLC